MHTQWLTMGDVLYNVLGVAGLVVVAGGFWSYSPPLGMIVAGVMLFVVVECQLAARKRRKGDKHDSS